MVIKFEHLDPSGDEVGTLVVNGYRNLTWGNLQAINPNGGDYANSGLAHGSVSGRSVAYNAFESDGVIKSDDGDFSFKSGYFTGAFNNGLTVTVTAYDNNVLVGQKVFVVNYDAPTFVRFGAHFNSVDEVYISSTGGTDASPDDNGSGRAVAMDDLDIVFVAARETAQHADHADAAHVDLAQHLPALSPLHESGFSHWMFA